jgi:uncharacterized protein involved in exopolysaccharide biosynthesis
MAELDKVPQKQSIDIETVKIEETVLENITTLNKRQSVLITDFGSIYVRKKELNEELKQLDMILEKAEDEFKLISEELKETLEALDDKYPQARINLQEGYLQYQPGALSRKQLAEQQQKEADELRNSK